MRYLAVAAVVVAVAGSVAMPSLAAETSVSRNDIRGCKPLTPRALNQIVTALSAPDFAVQRQLPPICDSLGYTWNLDVQGPSITGTFTAAGCGTYPVSGGHTGPSFSIVADITGNPCYCNSFHQFDGVVNVPTRTITGTAFSYGGCEGQAPCTAGLCQQP